MPPKGKKGPAKGKKGTTKGRAPIDIPEDSETDVDIVENPTTTNNIEDSEDEEATTPKTKNKTAKKPTHISMVSYQYEMNENHLFYMLNKKTGSIDVTKILTKNFDKNNVRFQFFSLKTFFSFFSHVLFSLIHVLFFL